MEYVQAMVELNAKYQICTAKYPIQIFELKFGTKVSPKQSISTNFEKTNVIFQRQNQNQRDRTNSNKN